VSKRHNSKEKICRRLGENIWGRPGASVDTRNYPPGMHGRRGHKRSTDYGVQLLAKQKMREHYGDVSEKQFRGIYKEATRKKGDTIENLVGLLESRLDAFIFRANFVPTIFAARQFVNHKHVKVNNRKVNIPSYVLKPGDVVELTDKAKQMKIVIESVSSNERPLPGYIALDVPNMSATYVKVPAFEEIPYAAKMEPHLVIEFYSRS
jgi:small subunit ribosomal protein S4